MANPRRTSYPTSQSTDNHFYLTRPQIQSALSCLQQFLNRPRAIPLLLSFFLLLTWASLSIQRYSHFPSNTQLPNHEQPKEEDKFGREYDEKVNMVRFRSGFPSLIAKDKRGWLLNPVSLALDSGVKDGAVSCASLHVGQIQPQGVRGNHRHHDCNETFVIWGAKTKFRLEKNQVSGKDYAEIIVDADEVAVVASPSGTAHALVNVDTVHSTYFLGCQDSVINYRDNYLFPWGSSKNVPGLVISLILKWLLVVKATSVLFKTTRNELRGCINDVLDMKEMLVNRFGFDHTIIELLTDAPGTLELPTGFNIKKALDRMVHKADAGDVLFFHYSGHGTRIPRHGNPALQDEAIVPCGFNLITDMDFRQLVNRIPKGASFTILSDSCHSGGLIDKEEQIGPHLIAKIKNTAINSQYPETIPYEFILNHLSSRTTMSTSDIGTHLLQCFGENASIKFQSAKKEIDSFIPLKGDEGILLSGCQANETSADMRPKEQGAKAYGAFSNAVQMVLRGNSLQLSNKEEVMIARKLLEEEEFVQHPCLYCSDEMLLLFSYISL